MNTVSILNETDKHDRLSVALLSNNLPIKINASITIDFEFVLSGDVHIHSVITELFGGHYGIPIDMFEVFSERAKEIYIEFRNKFHVRIDFLAAIDYIINQLNDHDFGLIINAIPELIIKTLLSNHTFNLGEIKNNKSIIEINPITILEECYISLNDFIEADLLLDYAEKAILELD